MRLRCNTAACRELLPAVLASFLSDHPGTDVALAEARSEEVARSLAAGEADLGIVSDAVDDGGLERRPLRRDPLALVAPAGHVLADRDEVALADAVGHPFVGLVEGSALQEHVDAHARRLAARRDAGGRMTANAATRPLEMPGTGPKCKRWTLLIGQCTTPRQGDDMSCRPDVCESIESIHA